jgi:hypothetical protein
MALQDGFPSASGLADANDVRLALAGLMVRDSSGNPRTGIFFRNTDALVTSTATMNSSVAAFEAALSRSGQGVILLANNGATNVLHDAAPVANSRYDTIYMKQNDAVAPNADANSLPVFGILKGAPSVSPTLPTYATAKTALDAAPGIGAGAEPLAAVLIPSTATSMQSGGVVYTQLYQYTATTGGVVPFRTKAALDLWTTAQKEQQAVVLADSSRFRYTGAAWEQTGSTVQLKMGTVSSVIVSTPQRGVDKITGAAAATISKTVTFPAAYSTIPVVTGSSIGGRLAGAFDPSGLIAVGGTEITVISATTTTGFTVNIRRADGPNLSASYDYYFAWNADGVKA